MKNQEEREELDEVVGKLRTLEKCAVSKKMAFYKSNRESLIDHIAEEIADVRIMLDQIEFGLRIEKRCADWREFKIQRQLKRIESDAHIGTQV